jgi:hypothetical protein
MILTKLYHSPIINTAELATKMYPHLSKRVASSKIYNKVQEQGGQRILPADEKLAAKAWADLIKEINSKQERI